jgi:alpha(1,3/1,4) fucosyltransferase
MRQLKINFTDFWGGFNKEDNLFTAMLRKHYDIVLSDNPDILIYSCFGFAYMKYSCHRIFYAGENARPDFKECDFALSFDYESYGNKNLRLPLYRWRGDLEAFTRPKNVEAILQEKKKFCCMLVSNPDGKERNLFFEKLSRYKKIDSAGKHLNNMGGKRVADKMEFIKEYKFTMSFENASYPGYTTEKLVEPMAVNSIPIYWGNPMVANDFNSKSFINIHDYKTVDAAIERIIEIDNNDTLYKQYLAEPYFKENIFPDSLNMELLSEKLKIAIDDILSTPAVSSKIMTAFYCRINNSRRKLFARVYKKPYWSF